MLEVKKNENGSLLTISPVGRIDSVTAPAFQDSINGAENFESVVLDFAGLEYISSAGLRVLLLLKKAVNDKSLKLINVNSDVMDVLEMTGFTDLLTIE